MHAATGSAHIWIRAEAPGFLWIDFAPASVLDARDAPVLIDILKRAASSAPGRVHILVDVANARGANAEYRAKVAEYLEADGQNVVIACYNQNAFMHAMIALVAKATHVQLKAFRDEAAARAWLDSGGSA